MINECINERKQNLTTLKHKPPTSVSGELLDNLVRGLGHDMGAHVRHIVEFSKMLQHSTEPREDSNRDSAWLNMMIDSGNQLQTMLAQLAKLSVLYNQTTVLTEDIDMGTLFDSVREQYLERIDLVADRDIELTLPDQWPVITGNLVHWETLLSVLFENALTFQPRAIEQTIQIHIDCRETATDVLFTISDNGIGVEKKYYRDIIRPFKKLNAAKVYPGLGLGLYSCEYIAELNQGSLAFEKSPLGGLTAKYKQPKY